MLEKIGLPPKPAQRGNNWVVDASHCQGCSSQFTFINRKHHCRRCGGLFCGSCTQQRMVLRGQGDSPVRICEPCKKLEEAARFELRHGNKSRSGRGGTKLTSRHEDEVLKQVLGNDSAEILGQASANGMVSSVQRSTSSASSSNIQEVAKQDEGKEVLRSLSVEEPGHLLTEIGSSSPEELRRQALDEKKKYKTLKAEGKSEEALRAFKRGKELERQAGSLELLLRKNRKKAVSLSSMPEIQKFEDNPKDTGNKNKLSHKNVNEKDDFAGELRQLGWSDMELHVGDKKPASMSLEGELSKLLGEAFQRPKKEKETHGVDQTQIIAHKKKALALKREGKLGEAKEELKRAKVLEKQLEEQIFLAEAEDSDDELSSLMRSLDVDKQEEFPVRYEADTGFDFDHLLGITDDPGVSSNFEVTDEDMDDPEMVDALKSLGWTEESNLPVEIKPHFVPFDRDALLSEIQSLKAEALSKKREGNTAEAIALLKKAKVLEKELENCSTQGSGLMAHNLTMVQNVSISQSSENSSNVMGRKDMGSKLAPKSRVMIQKELLGLKKRALALRREGRLEEADEELKKGKVLEQQLEEIDSSSKVKVMQVNVSNKHADNLETLDLGDVEEDVTDEDMHDPTLISLLGNLGWKDEEDENVRFPSKPTKQTDSISVRVGDSSVMPASNATKVGVSRRSKGEIQRELLGLKRKALSLRRKGEVDEADEVLKMAKVLEAQLAEIEMPSQEVHVEIGKHMGNKIINSPVESALDEEDVAEEDMHNPELLLVLKNLGWKDEIGTVTEQAEPSQQISGSSAHSDGLSMIQSSLVPPRSKQEIQKEVLGLKRKALSLRRQGKTEEAEEVLKMAKLLEVKMEELEAPKEEVLADALNVRENEGTAQAAGYPIDTVAGRASGLGRKQSDSSEPRPTRNTDISIPETTQLIEDKHPLSKLGLPGELKNTEVTGSIPPSGHSTNVIDLLTGDDWRHSQSPPKNFDAKYIRDDSSAKLGFEKSPVEDIEGEVSVAHEKRNERVPLNNKPQVDGPIFVQVTVSQNDQSSLRKEILAHKRQAVALKREGKLVEAREELRQAKLLEKSLEDNSNPQPPISSSSVSSSTSRVTSIEQKESSSSNLAPRPLSGRDRFKLQQESLSHKRLALKLRREGRTEEADAEFELAKALEAQLEESGAQSSSKSSVNISESRDDIGIEDFLDPQLLSALKAIGLEDANSAPRGPERLEPEKPNQERIQLEEQIKAEKVKAVNLKRSGKQAEAVDALRRAKLLEKKLSSLAS